LSDAWFNECGYTQEEDEAGDDDPSRLGYISQAAKQPKTADCRKDQAPERAMPSSRGKLALPNIVFVHDGSPLQVVLFMIHYVSYYIFYIINHFP
jgi:hypothetical protein